MKYFSITLTSILVLYLLFVGCSLPTEVGSELIENEATTLHNDSLKLTVETILGDSVKTFDSTFVLSNYLLGNYKDDAIGISKAELNIQYGLSELKSKFGNTKNLMNFDSAAIYFIYDSINCKGNLNSIQKLEVYKITEVLDHKKAYWSNQNIAHDPIPITSFDFIPNLSYDYYDKDTTQSKKAFLRIPLPSNFVQELFNIVKDTLNTESDDKFTNLFKGLKFKIKETTPAMLSFNLSSQNISYNVVPTFSNITCYYADTLGKTQKYFLTIGNTSGNYNVRTVNFSHTYNPDIQALLNNPSKGDSMLVVQGMNGLNAKITLPDLKSLGNIIVNKAELEFTAFLDNNQLISVPRILIIRNKTDGTKVVIRDIIEGANYYGGTPELYVIGNGVLKQKYTFNISAYLQDYIRGIDGATDQIYFIADSKSQNPNRVILYGPRAKQFPAILKLSYTKLKQ